MGVNISVAQDAEVYFANHVFSPARVLTLPTGTLVAGTNFSAVLLYGMSDSSLTAHTQPARFRVTTTSQPGTWSGGVRTLHGIANVPGTIVRLQVAVFVNSQYPNFDAARAAGAAWARPPFDYIVPTPPLGPTALDMVNFQGGILEPLPPIPEPSVVGLLVLGALALVINRRRRG